MQEEKEKKVINYLKKNGKSPTTQIQVFTKINHYELKPLLIEMKKKELIKLDIKNKFEYWELV